MLQLNFWNLTKIVSDVVQKKQKESGTRARDQQKTRRDLRSGRRGRIRPSVNRRKKLMLVLEWRGRRRAEGGKGLVGPGRMVRRHADSEPASRLGAATGGGRNGRRRGRGKGREARKWRGGGRCLRAGGRSPITPAAAARSFRRRCRGFSCFRLFRLHYPTTTALHPWFMNYELCRSLSSPPAVWSRVGLMDCHLGNWAVMGWVWSLCKT